MRVATDIGGTFTDLVLYDYDKETGKLKNIRTAKTDTTPPHFEEGILNALDIAAVDLKEVAFLAHGTTVVINALTERKGARTGLVTTKGFRDVLEIARSNRPDLFNFNFVKQAPFVPRHLRLEVAERMTYKGEVHQDLKEEDVLLAAAIFEKEKVEAIAVCCLHAYQNPVHEQAIATILKKALPNIPIICSHEVNREWREYERTSSTVLSAYVTPTTRHYLNRLATQLEQKGLKQSPYIMQSNGGITTIDAVKQNPITIVESGPASGMLGAAELGKVMQRKNLIVLDIGGTTAKCSLIENGQLKITTNYKIEHSRTQAGYPIQTPVIDIVEIGNGGGSIAWVDAGGKLHVGPQSAGALPGPAAYGKGGKAVTTTDANLFCGRIHPDFFLGGKMQPDLEQMQFAFEQLAQQLGMEKRAIANGILNIANANMVNALKLISVNKGYDPRDFSLLVIGGGGAMHAAYLADELQISEIIVPVNAGVFSALGMLMSDLRRDFLRTHVRRVTKEELPFFKSILKEMEKYAIESYKKDGFSKKDIEFEYHADMRYAGQEHYVKIPFKKRLNNAKQLEQLVQKFHKAHKKQYTFELDTAVEWVNFHLVAKVPVEKPSFPKVANQSLDLDGAVYGNVEVDFGKFGKANAAIIEREKLAAGMTFSGPAIIAEAATSTVLPPNFQLRVDEWGNLIITMI
jgi:N-methylhydantoinase A